MTEFEVPNNLAQQIQSAGIKATRQIIAIVGPPASGKSTLADALCEKFGAVSTVVPMDGFHLDNSILDGMGLRRRKGSPESFDVEGLCNLAQRISTQQHVYFPVFDRDRDLAIAQAGAVTHEHKLVFLEGNYLLLDEPWWRDIREHCDLSVFLDVPRDVLERRLIERWRHYGLDQDTMDQQICGNDLINFDRIIANSLQSDCRLSLG